MDIQDSNRNEKTSFIEQLAQRLGISANAATIYGEPVERGGVTVIPAAKAMYGFGGGTGMKAGEEGSGGGGGVAIKPVGYIEMKDGNTRFRAIHDPQTLVKAMAVGGIVAVLIAKTIAKMLHR